MDLSGYTPEFLKRCLERTEARTASDEEIDLARAFLIQQEAAQLQANNQLEEEIRNAEQERDQIRLNIQALDGLKSFFFIVVGTKSFVFQDD